MWRRIRVEWFLLRRQLTRAWRKTDQPLGENYPVFARRPSWVRV